jgi:DNA topoisomerase-2
MKKTTLEEFLNTEMLNYSVYKLIQQIPFLQDGMSQTARKIIWTLLNKPVKKYKSADSYNLIYDYTNYLHGDASAINVWETLSAKYKNNINLLDPKGSFGYRVLQQAAAPRYTSSIISQLTLKLFDKKDFPILKHQTLEGKQIEPVFLSPVLPIALINGFNGIAVGYSSSIIPRDPKYVIELIISILSGKTKKIPKYIPVKYPYFNGTIEKGENDKQFIFYGKIEKGKSTKKFGTIYITEVPPSYDRDKMVKIISDLEEENIVVDFNESCVKNTFNFEIKVPIEIYNESEEKLLQRFKLIQKQSEVLTFIFEDIDDPVNTEFKSKKELEEEYLKKEIKTYNNIAEYLHDWILQRLKIYRKRKIYILNNIKYLISIAKEKIRFIEAILNKDIIIERKSKKEIIDQLISQEFMKVDDSFNYLINMPLYSLSQDKMNEYHDEVKKLEQEYLDLENKEPKELWLEDLKNIYSDIVKELKSKI